ncbi:LysM peptidoglycan-binding domain-containing protein [Catellatospora sichuanensis]|uniref:LysM peptidoglycan-binding domain-containing protein n=1 Tax=Catellatospora sichuanensis TaxID=1969805 RepID=UPI001C90EB6D|nr:LysM domain-containing protein [Catellatospora sichuanensis]
MALRRWSAVRTGPTGDGILDLIARYYPKRAEVYVTSGMDGDHGEVSHHYGLHHRGSPTAAIDFGVGADARMGRDLAKWIEDEFGDLCVELIHTTPFADDDGFYVKNGKPIASYGAATDAAHADHVHLAMSAAQVAKALARLAKKAGGAAPGPARKRAPRKAAKRAATPKKAATSKKSLPPAAYHTVRAGDTLTAIAGRYQTTVPALVKLNPVITDPDLIQIDQRLRVS